MALSNAFEEAVMEGNVRKIRIMLKDSLLADPSSERFKEMEKAAVSVEGLYDEHDGRTLVENPDEWDDSYMDKIMVQVVSNFSHERVDHLVEVVRKLRPAPQGLSDSTKTTSQESRSASSSFTKTVKSNHQSSYQEQKRKDQESGDYRRAKVIKGAIVGGAVGGAVGIGVSFTGAAVAGCVVVGAAVGAASVYYFG